MSITLTIDNPATDEDRTRSIPVATEHVFRMYWAPACAALGLTLVSAFSTGIVVGASDLPPLLDELQRLRSWVGAHLQAEAASHVEQRVAIMIRELPALTANDRRVFIG